MEKNRVYKVTAKKTFKIYDVDFDKFFNDFMSAFYYEKCMRDNGFDCQMYCIEAV